MVITSLKYLHLDEGIFCQARRLAWCIDSKSYASGSIATSRATLAGQVKGEHPDTERYTGPPGWGLGRWASILSPRKKTHMLKNLDKGLEKWTVHLINDINSKKFNELWYMECSRHLRKNGRNNVRIRKNKNGCNRTNRNKMKGHRFGNSMGLRSSL